MSASPNPFRRYGCLICSYAYDEARGDPERGIPPGTRWEGLPVDWVCPWCGADKCDFYLEDE